MAERGVADGTMNLIVSYIRKLFTSKYLSLVFRVYIGAIFITAGMSKLVYPAEFAENLAAYRLVPYWLVNFLAVAVPWTELICGLFLIIGLMTSAASAILVALLIGFNIFVSINIIRGTEINCGCFDSVGEQISWKKVMVNFSWMLLTLQIFFYDRILQIRRQRLSWGKKRP